MRPDTFTSNILQNSMLPSQQMSEMPESLTWVCVILDCLAVSASVCAIGATGYGLWRYRRSIYRAHVRVLYKVPFLRG